MKYFNNFDSFSLDEKKLDTMEKENKKRHYNNTYT